jgi:hypothetical protein
MQDTVVQAAIWLLAGLFLVMLMARRRKRKVLR